MLSDNIGRSSSRVCWSARKSTSRAKVQQHSRRTSFHLIRPAVDNRKTLRDLDAVHTDVIVLLLFERKSDAVEISTSSRETFKSITLQLSTDRRKCCAARRRTSPSHRRWTELSATRNRQYQRGYASILPYEK